MPNSEHIGRIATLDGLTVSMAQVANRVVVSNGHARPAVTDGNAVWPIGLRGPFTKPDVADGGAGNTTGTYRFATQFWHERGVPSNLSRFSEEITVAGGIVDVTLNLDDADVWRDLKFDSDAGLVAIWALNVDTGECKMVGRTTLATTTYSFDMLPTDFDAIIAEDRIANAIGLPDEPVSIGHDIFPACKYVTEYNGRLWGFGQADFDHPGCVDIVPTTNLAMYFQLIGYSAGDATTLAAIYDDLYGTAKTMVRLNPYALDPDEGVFWSHSDKIYVGLAPNRESILVMINGEAMARISRGGHWYLRGEMIDANLVENGTFDGIGGWHQPGEPDVLPTDWYTYSGVCGHVVGSSTAIEQDFRSREPHRRFLSGSYRVIFTVSGRTAGSVRVFLGTTAGTSRSTNATFTETLTPAGQPGPYTTKHRIAFLASADFDGAISAVKLYREMPAATSQIEYDEERHGISFSIQTAAGPAVYEKAFTILPNGDFQWDGPCTTLSVYDGVGTQTGETAAIAWYLSAPAYSYLYFLPFPLWGSVASKAYLDLDLNNDVITFHANSVTEDASTTQLSNSPLFDQGLLYKALRVRGEFVGYVYDVMDERVLFLDRDLSTDPQFNVTDWLIEGMPYLYYSRFGYPESGFFGLAMSQQGRGSFFSSEFDADAEGRTPAGLYVAGGWLHVVFRQGEYMIRTTSTQTPLPGDTYEIVKKPSRASVLSPRSIAAGSRGERYALVCRPRGIGVVDGNRTEILTDAIGSRRALTEDCEASSLLDAAGAFWSGDRGDAYVLCNIDRVGESGGTHGLFVDVRDKPHLVELDGMAMAALTPMLADDGSERLVYGGRNGRIGYAFDEPKEIAEPTPNMTEFAALDNTYVSWTNPMLETGIVPWSYRLYLAPTGMRRFTITKLRLYASAPENFRFRIDCAVYAVGANVPRDELLGDLSDYESRYVVFDETTVSDVDATAVDNIQSSAFVIQLSGAQRHQIRLKGLGVFFRDVEGDGLTG